MVVQINPLHTRDLMLAEVSSRIAPPPWFQHLLGEHLVDEVRLADGGEAEAELARGSGSRLRRRWTGRADSVGLRRRKFNVHMEFAPRKRSLPAGSPSVGGPTYGGPALDATGAGSLVWAAPVNGRLTGQVEGHDGGA